MTLINRQWIYHSRPQNSVGEDNYLLAEEQLSDDLANGEVLIAARYISVDPYMRIQQAEGPSWEEPHPLNTVQQGGVVAQVIKSKATKFQQGDWVLAYSGWQEYARVHAGGLSKLDPEAVPVSTALGVLGMPGRTAWFGLMEAGKPLAGETIVVSGAAGAVGSLVVQFAKKQGCKVIGIVGSQAKADWLTGELGADAALIYSNAQDSVSLGQQLADICDGVDVYFDNVGGWISDGVIPLINNRARIVICGQISQYNGGLDNVDNGPRFLHHLIYQRATIQGILARDSAHRMDEMVAKVAPWVSRGEIIFNETLIDGFEQLPGALAMLFEGKNTGKLLVRIGEENAVVRTS